MIVPVLMLYAQIVSLKYKHLDEVVIVSECTDQVSFYSLKGREGIVVDYDTNGTQRRYHVQVKTITVIVPESCLKPLHSN